MAGVPSNGEGVEALIPAARVCTREDCLGSVAVSMPETSVSDDADRWESMVAERLERGSDRSPGCRAG